MSLLSIFRALTNGECRCSNGLVLFLFILEYVYSKRLRALEEGSSDGPSRLPEEACMIQTSLKPDAWRELLQEHPDRWFAEYIVRGIKEGFRIGFHGNQDSLKSRMQNMVSAR